MDSGRQITSALKQQIERFQPTVKLVETGSVTSIADGIARIRGLTSIGYSELIEFPYGLKGIALNLEEDSVAAIILGDYSQLKEGDEVRPTNRIAEVPVGEPLIGRM